MGFSYRGQVEFSVPKLTSQQAQVTTFQLTLHASAMTPNMYVATMYLFLEQEPHEA
jgi:hypothetical protein